MTKRNEKVPELSHIAEGSARRVLEGKSLDYWNKTTQERLRLHHEAQKFLDGRREVKADTALDKIKKGIKSLFQ